MSISFPLADYNINLLGAYTQPSDENLSKLQLLMPKMKQVREATVLPLLFELQVEIDNARNHTKIKNILRKLLPLSGDFKETEEDVKKREEASKKPIALATSTEQGWSGSTIVKPLDNDKKMDCTEEGEITSDGFAVFSFKATEAAFAQTMDKLGKLSLDHSAKPITTIGAEQVGTDIQVKEKEFNPFMPTELEPFDSSPSKPGAFSFSQPIMQLGAGGFVGAAPRGLEPFKFDNSPSKPGSGAFSFSQERMQLRTGDFEGAGPRRSEPFTFDSSSSKPGSGTFSFSQERMQLGTGDVEGAGPRRSEPFTFDSLPSKPGSGAFSFSQERMQLGTGDVEGAGPRRSEPFTFDSSPSKPGSGTFSFSQENMQLGAGGFVGAGPSGLEPFKFDNSPSKPGSRAFSFSQESMQLGAGGFEGAGPIPLSKFSYIVRPSGAGTSHQSTGAHTSTPAKSDRVELKLDSSKAQLKTELSLDDPTIGLPVLQKFPMDLEIDLGGPSDFNEDLELS